MIYCHLQLLKLLYVVTAQNLWEHKFSVAKATLKLQISVRLSVCLSVTETPQPLRIAPIDHQAYQTSSLATIKPINH